jgi:hypothetical protein
MLTQAKAHNMVGLLLGWLLPVSMHRVSDREAAAVGVVVVEIKIKAKIIPTCSLHWQ